RRPQMAYAVTSLDSLARRPQTAPGEAFPMIDPPQAAPAGEAVRHFIAPPLDQLLGRGAGQEPATAAATPFHDIVPSVPAYGEFLVEQSIDAARVRSPQDFQALPLVTKQNYLMRHPLARLCRGGRLESCDFVAVSSGSTGKPTFWPRFLADE